MSWGSPDDDLDDYHHKFPLKWFEHYRLDDTRRSMFKELQKDYERKLAWARSLGIGTIYTHFREMFCNPPVPCVAPFVAKRATDSDANAYADPLAEDFDPSAPVPSELSSWLYLFYCYLRVEEEYAEVGEWLKFWGGYAIYHLHRYQGVCTCSHVCSPLDMMSLHMANSKNCFDLRALLERRPITS